MSLTDQEFRTLRETIASRGTIRMALVPLTLSAWAGLAVSLHLFGEWPIASLFPLLVLVAGFEAAYALHTGVERIGRYLQVFYETDRDGPQWETTAMRLGPGLPGGPIDPLFTALFAAATLANLLIVLTPRPLLTDVWLPASVHLAVIVRMVRARRAAAGQRAADLRAFERVRTDRSTLPGPAPRSTD